jgi:hypothetical protein
VVLYLDEPNVRLDSETFRAGQAQWRVRDISGVRVGAQPRPVAAGIVGFLLLAGSAWFYFGSGAEQGGACCIFMAGYAIGAPVLLGLILLGVFATRAPKWFVVISVQGGETVAITTANPGDASRYAGAIAAAMGERR